MEHDLPSRTSGRHRPECSGAKVLVGPWETQVGGSRLGIRQLRRTWVEFNTDFAKFARRWSKSSPTCRTPHRLDRRSRTLVEIEPDLAQIEQIWSKELAKLVAKFGRHQAGTGKHRLQWVEIAPGLAQCAPKW